jgi:hypothetical protein
LENGDWWGQGSSSSSGTGEGHTGLISWFLVLWILDLYGPEPDLESLWAHYGSQPINSDHVTQFLGVKTRNRICFLLLILFILWLGGRDLRNLRFFNQTLKETWEIWDSSPCMVSSWYLVAFQIRFVLKARHKFRPHCIEKFGGIDTHGNVHI